MIATAKIVLSLALLWTGFRSVSDDDFARAIIAQQFAIHPHLDPSGSSWLPFPFLLWGSAMAAFGPTLAAAKIMAIGLGACAAVGVWWVARSIGLSARAAFVGGMIAACMPHAAYYGAAMVPEYATAVLALLASATLSSKHDRIRAAGALAACLATLCRYETWPVACVVSICATFDAIRQPQRRLWLVVSAIIASLGATAWLFHGFVHHHDALFFVTRVAAYRRALGGESMTLSLRLLQQPLALFTGEPELTLLALLLPAIVLWVCGRPGLRGRAWVRLCLAIGALVAFLMVGDLLDGAATHHEDRTLLLAWLAMALLVGELLDRLLRKARFSPLRLAVSVGVLTAVVAATLIARPRITKPDSFVDRSREIAIGRLAAALVPAGQRLAVYTEDYGFFAIQAGFARPFESAPLLRHDPRQREHDPLASPAELTQRLDALCVQYLIVPTARLPPLSQQTRIETESNGFALLSRR
jgi:hypothetical protein